MALGKQLPIRLEQNTEKRLEIVAAKIGTSKSALIRLLAETFVDQVVRPDGSVILPPNWHDLSCPNADGRTKRIKNDRLPLKQKIKQKGLVNIHGNVSIKK